MRSARVPMEENSVCCLDSNTMCFAVQCLMPLQDESAQRCEATADTAPRLAELEPAVVSVPVSNENTAVCTCIHVG